MNPYLYNFESIMLKTITKIILNNNKIKFYRFTLKNIYAIVNNGLKII